MSEIVDLYFFEVAYILAVLRGTSHARNYKVAMISIHKLNYTSD